MDAELDQLVAQATKGLSSHSDDALIEELQARGHRVELSPRAGEGQARAPVAIETGSTTFGVVSDTHLASKYQQLTYLQDFYKYADSRGAEFILHCGDMVEGTHHMHRDAAYWMFQHGFDAQVDYAAETYPVLDGRRTLIINGNHDMSHFNDVGSNVGRRLAEHRADIEFVGDLGAHIEIGTLKAYLWHPDGGVPYARSYRVQRWIEQVPPEQKPHLLCTGHLHVSDMLPNYRNVTGMLIPCFQAQTPYLRRKGLGPDIGGVVVTVAWDEYGLVRVATDWRLYRRPIERDY